MIEGWRHREKPTGYSKNFHAVICADAAPGPQYRSCLPTNKCVRKWTGKPLLLLATIPSKNRREVKEVMKSLVKALILCGALSLWTSVAQADVHMQCSAPKCAYSEEIGPSQTKRFIGQCVNKKAFEYSMVCHAVKGTTCLKAGSDTDRTTWSCSCTNWDPTGRKYVTIDLLCSD